MSVSSGATIASAWDTQTYLSIAPADHEGAARAQSRVQRCRPRARVARYRPPRVTVPTARSMGWCSVLTPAASLRRPRSALVRKRRLSLHSSRLRRSSGRSVDRGRSSGKALYVGQAWDPGIAAPGWRQWKLGTSQTAHANAANATLMAGALAHSSSRLQIRRLRSRASTSIAIRHGWRPFPRSSTPTAMRPCRVPQTRRQAADLSWHGRSHLFGTRIDRLLPASHPQQRRRLRARPPGRVCFWCQA